MKQIQEQLGFDALYKAYSHVLAAGIQYLTSGGKVEIADVSEVVASSVIDAIQLNDLLIDARVGRVDRFLTVCPWQFLLVFQRMIDLYDDFSQQLFIFQYVSKVAYVLYLFPPEQLRLINPSGLVPDSLTNARHPLLEVLVDISNIELNTEQQGKVKELLIELNSDSIPDPNSDPIKETNYDE